ncbi:hypothetical protein JCM14635_40450 [Megalodesulfovibrio paquesii]
MEFFTKHIGLVAFIFLLATGGPAAAAAGQDCYRNSRFGYELCLPAGALTARPEADNGDGRRFLAPDGGIELLVWAAHNALDETLPQAYAQARQEDGLQVTYHTTKKDWFVVSGYLNGRILYQKTWLRQDVFYSIRLVYDAARKAEVDPLLQRALEGFHF